VRELVAREKPPDGPVAKARSAMIFEPLAQLHDGHARLGVDLAAKEIGVRFDPARPSVASHPRGGDAARGLSPLGPANRGGHADVKPRCGLPPRKAAVDRLS